MTALSLPQTKLSRIPPPQVSSNLYGAAVGLASTASCAVYQVLAAKKQRDLGLSGTQVRQPSSAPSCQHPRVAHARGLEACGGAVLHAHASSGGSGSCKQRL